MVPVAMVNNSVAIWKNLPGLPLAGNTVGFALRDHGLQQRGR
jgi:hypothetical protein